MKTVNTFHFSQVPDLRSCSEIRRVLAANWTLDPSMAKILGLGSQILQHLAFTTGAVCCALYIHVYIMYDV